MNTGSTPPQNLLSNTPPQNLFSNTPPQNQLCSKPPQGLFSHTQSGSLLAASLHRIRFLASLRRASLECSGMWNSFPKLICRMIYELSGMAHATPYLGMLTWIALVTSSTATGKKRPNALAFKTDPANNAKYAKLASKGKGNTKAMRPSTRQQL